MLPQERQTLPPVAGNLHRQPYIVQSSAKDVSDRRLIIDDEHPSLLPGVPTQQVLEVSSLVELEGRPKRSDPFRILHAL
jgi:hypothetical protein